MHRFLCGVLVVWIAVQASAAPVPGLSVPAPPVSPRLHSQADLFAFELLQVAGKITDEYVRPVKRVELLSAALTGLYETARVPLPSNVMRDLEAAQSNEDVLAVVTRARERLGDVEEVRGTEAILAACRGLARKLDAHSTVVTGEALRRGIGVDEQTSFGLELEDSEKPPMRVRFVHPGGPAQRAGLRPDDLVTRVDDKSVKPVNALAVVQGQGAEIVPASMSDQNPEVTVTFRRGREAERTVKFQRETFQPETILGVVRRDDNSWNYWLDREHKIAQVRITGIGNTTALDLRTTLDKLTEEGLRGLILDVRWCPGGYLRQAVQVAGLFLGECDVATVTGRTDDDTVYKNTAEKGFRNVPMVVLVNGGTTGGAELIAAALQDHKRAVVAGMRTVGKGSVQIHLPLSAPDAGFKLTTRTLLRPSGKNLHRFPDSSAADDWGVKPNQGLELRLSADLDRQLKDWWLLQTLRPGGDKEQMPLDDPMADTQRQAALEELLKSEH